MKKESTKKQFLTEALKLFAEFGYDSVSISQIAERVGCSAPALYKHYSGKQALFDAIIELSELSYEERMKSIHKSFWNNEKSDYFLTEKGQIEFVIKLFESALSEEYPRLFRNFIISEKSKNPELSKIYNERYIFSQYGFFEEIIKEVSTIEDLSTEVSELSANDNLNNENIIFIKINHTKHLHPFYIFPIKFHMSYLIFCQHVRHNQICW